MMESELGYYVPREDSKLLRKAISKLNNKGRFLEIGFGSGANLVSLEDRYSLVVGTDVLPLNTIKTVKQNTKCELIQCDSATCFRDGIFDVIAFNPPYLPSEEIRDRAVDGGAKGLEIPFLFLAEAQRVSASDCEIVLILSSENDLEAFADFCDKHGLECSKMLESGQFFETLYAFKVVKKNQTSRLVV